MADSENCGVFKPEMREVEKVGCHKDEERPYQPAHAIDEKDAELAIEFYCNMDLALDPDFKCPEGEFSHDRFPGSLTPMSSRGPLNIASW